MLTIRGLAREQLLSRSLAGLAAALLVLLLLGTANVLRWPTALMEGLGYLAVLTSLASFTALRQWLRRLPPATATALGLLLALSLTAQYARHAALLPFTRWAMYTEPSAKPEVKVLTYRLHFADGSHQEVVWPDAFPVPLKTTDTGFRLTIMLEKLSRHSDEASRASLAQALQVVGRRYNRWHSSRPAQRLEAWQTYVPLGQDKYSPNVQKMLVANVALVQD